VKDSIELTRDTRGMCVVKVGDREVIRDNGDVISHYATPAWLNSADLAGCLRGAVTAMEVLLERALADGIVSTLPGLEGLIERSKSALKEYDK
jgi:hydroxyethylthiazole kinase-like sugar kinase family protein